MKTSSKIFSGKSVLIVLLLAAALLIVPVTATDTPLFSIPGKTTVVFPNDGISTMSTVDYGPLNIPAPLLQPTAGLQTASVLQPAYQLVSFDNVIPVRSNTVTLPITLYGQSYSIPLTRMTFESIDDGIDTYQGTIPGITDSLVIITVAGDNLFYGSITLPDDDIEIYPVQNFNYTQITPEPLHIIYSENSIPESSVGLTLSGVEYTPFTDEALLTSIANSKAQSSSTNQLAIVGFLVGTDEELYFAEGSWIGKVQQLLGAITYAYEGQTGTSPGVCAYDSTMMGVFSADYRRFTNPVALTKEVYWDYFLEQKNADLAIYVSGNDADGSLIAKGTPYPERWAWMQMVPDQSSSTAAQATNTLHAKKYAAINALGYTFGATPNRATVTSSSATVMHDSYTGSSYNLLSFSPANAAVISSNKNSVAGHV